MVGKNSFPLRKFLLLSDFHLPLYITNSSQFPRQKQRMAYHFPLYLIPSNNSSPSCGHSYFLQGLWSVYMQDHLYLCFFTNSNDKPEVSEAWSSEFIQLLIQGFESRSLTQTSTWRRNEHIPHTRGNGIANTYNNRRITRSVRSVQKCQEITKV